MAQIPFRSNVETKVRNVQMTRYHSVQLSSQKGMRSSLSSSVRKDRHPDDKGKEKFTLQKGKEKMAP